MDYNIIPLPQSTEIFGTTYFDFADGILTDSCSSTIEKELVDFLVNNKLGISVNTDGKSVVKVEIIDHRIPDDLHFFDESYKIDINESIMTLSAQTKAGAYWGLQTIKQLFFNYSKSRRIPNGVIIDKPRYRYRGFLMDVVRHFFPIEFVKKQILAMSFHKLNRLHLHLTDDQGWRVEIKKYPELCRVGSRRTGTLGDNVPVEGFYTQAQIRELVEFARQHHVEIVPEFDLPGHFTAAIASYPYLSCRGEAIPVATSFGIKSDIACAGKESTYTFIYDVLDEIMELFPCKLIHIGGDEAVKLEWNNCPLCNAAVEREGLNNVFELQGAMTNKIIDYLEAKGKRVIVWNESLYGDNLRSGAICQYWSDGKTAEHVTRELNAGRQTIISKYTPFYLDYPHAMHSLRALYTFDTNLPNVTPEAQKNIIGLECPLWAEYVGDEERFENMAYPRLTALAEKAWSITTNSYDSFAKRLIPFYDYYTLFGIDATHIFDTNPKGFSWLGQMLSFGKNYLTRESIKTLRASINAQREVTALRQSLIQKHETKENTDGTKNS